MYNYTLANILIYLASEGYNNARELAKFELTNGNKGNFTKQD